MKRAAALLLIAATLTGCATTPEVGVIAEADDAEAGTLLIEKQSFHVRFDTLTYTGVGEYRWPDGRIYVGEFVAGQPHGIGIDTRPDGSMYEGDFDQGRRHGEGQLTLPDGSVYEGMFVNGARSGTGSYTSASGRYAGEWTDDAPNGYGRFDYADGSWYEGDWLMGRRNGSGRYQRDEESSYEGDWEHDLPHGFGVLTERNGFSYDGAFDGGERSGYGVIDVGDGIGYAGTWVENRRQGFGRESRPDGSEYLGEWREDRRNGQGTDRHADGSYHQGWWEDNTPLGPGTRRSREGVEISGSWNGSFVSSGVVELPSGDEYAGNLYQLSKRAISSRFLSWLKARAEDGNPHAMLLLAEAYLNYSKPVPDAAVARRYYERAAHAGIAEAQFQLAEMLLEAGDDDVDQALQWLMRAAQQGHAGANLVLGGFYQVGRHVAQSHPTAATYYAAAAKAGDLVARNNLAWLLATSPDDAVRDGNRAVTLSRPIAVLYDHWTYLDTLAAAYAEVGEFDHAVRTARRAVALAEGDAPSETLLQLEARLRTFEANEPFREINVEVGLLQ
ncbi:MAG: hypothetical protein HC809_02140 [Gammaproteobacteria bacterium]|nr:hypothetical protein [Gammaproteobacteria bacterium]